MDGSPSVESRRNHSQQKALRRRIQGASHRVRHAGCVTPGASHRVRYTGCVTHRVHQTGCITHWVHHTLGASHRVRHSWCITHRVHYTGCITRGASHRLHHTLGASHRVCHTGCITHWVCHTMGASHTGCIIQGASHTGCITYWEHHTLGVSHTGCITLVHHTRITHWVRHTGCNTLGASHNGCATRQDGSSVELLGRAVTHWGVTRRVPALVPTPEPEAYCRDAPQDSRIQGPSQTCTRRLQRETRALPEIYGLSSFPARGTRSNFSPMRINQLVRRQMWVTRE